mgnify:CR=1 FL=1
MNKYNKNAGFTLIEISMVLVIAGLILSGIALSLRVYRENAEFNQAKVNIDNAQMAIESFSTEFGRYPCPANPFVAMNSPSFGEEDCAWARMNTIEGARDADSVPGNDDVLVGLLPRVAFATGNGSSTSDINQIIPISTLVEYKSFREHGKQITDPWRNLFFYAVSANLTTGSTYDPALGVIKVTDEEKEDTGGIVDNAHYIIFSAGENGQDCDLWDRATVIGLDPSNPANAASVLDFENNVTPEGENCDGDSEFRIALQSRANTDDYYDDHLRYNQYENVTYWAPVSSYNESDDLYMVKTGKLSLGDNYRVSPTGDFVIDGSFLTASDQDLKLDVDGNIIADQMVGGRILCDTEDLEGDSCFNVRDITNIKCPNQGEYVKTVTLSNYTLSVTCEQIRFEVSGQSCGGNYVNGMYTDGVLVCESPLTFN